MRDKLVIYKKELKKIRKLDIYRFNIKISFYELIGYRYYCYRFMMGN